MQSYVLGLICSPDHKRTVLVRKNRPFWAEGKLNGPGGKIEETDSSPSHAMSRELAEETGLHIPPETWRPLHTLEDPHYLVYCFFATHPNIYEARTLTDEALEFHEMESLWNRTDLVPSMGLLITLAAQFPPE